MFFILSNVNRTKICIFYFYLCKILREDLLMWHKIKVKSVKALLWMIGSFPLGLLRFKARILGWILEYPVHYRVDVTDSNLLLAFPEKSPEERLKIRHRFYRHFATIFMEAVWFGASSHKRLRRSHIARITNPEVLNRAFEQAPSVMILSTHTGNWEIFGGIRYFDSDIPLVFDDYDICSVYRKIKNKVLDEVMKDIRISPASEPSRFDGYQESRHILRFVIEHKDKKRLYSMNTDQKPYSLAKNYQTVSFMGHECKSMTAAAGIAAKFSMAILYQHIWGREEGGYDYTYEVICEDASKMPVEEIVNRFYELLEGDLRRQPYNYLWTHKRWKLR